MAERQVQISQRIHSIDIARGVSMVLMAIGHVRVYAGVPAGGPTPPLFFTRWITSFAAPAFAFFAGTSAYLLGQRVGDRRALSRYLFTRGLVLVLLELTVIRVAWTFNFDFGHYLLAGVIWMLGWCMTLLAALIWLPTPAIGAFGVAVIALHNVVNVLPVNLEWLSQRSPAWLWQILYFGGPIQLGHNGPTLMVLYSIVPWIGVMAAGYAFGAVVTLEPSRRDRTCVRLGAAAIALFLVLRTAAIYGDPREWHLFQPSPVPTLFRFLDTTRNTASLQFLLMTLGPTILLLPRADRLRGRIGQFLATFGRVPMFYYLLHIPAIHFAAVLVSLVREGRADPWLFVNRPMMNPAPPEGYTWNLLLLYGVFVLVAGLLYFPCRWYARKKTTSPARWMRYI